MIMYHGLADVLIMPQGSVNYYERVIREMDGLREVQKFYRFFLCQAWRTASAMERPIRTPIRRFPAPLARTG